MHPELGLGCDVPETPTGSTWIDIRAGSDGIVVEYHPELGFGFSDPRDENAAFYGMPSSRYVHMTDEALDQMDRTLRALATPPAHARSGA